MIIEPGINTTLPYLEVRHSELERSTEESPFRSQCLACDQGEMLIHRYGFGGDDPLSRGDNCCWCGQHYLYLDDKVGSEPFTETLEEGRARTQQHLDTSYGEAA